ncbi:zinc-dependent metalloprotease [Streptomyces sp. NPDC004539]|uniref:zinc-dependent metalloprotease n=1 Tax=Streptomyces sp. NPDC004539 TaxID=3154280 RepID=UPI0033BE28DC
MPGFLELVPDPDGRPLLGVRRFDEPFLLTVSLSQGLGSSELWLDRGRAGKARLVEFRRVGQRVLFVVRNKHFLSTGDAASVRAGAESFAVSVVWSGPVLREEGGLVVVDATGLALYDHDQVAGHLAERGQGDYVLDDAASVPLAPSASAGGVRLPALLTFRGPGRGAAVRVVAADPRALSVVQQLNLVPLPDSALPVRSYHPRSGGYGVGYVDHGLGGRQVKFQPRFRVGGGAPAVVFQVDPAVPEPLRSAVVEGGNWWREGFAGIGLPEAYRVEAGSADFDPYEPGVNGVVWVHRAGRGWSLGQGLTDPRTGEVLHARVRLGSQRVEQVRALGEALLAPYGHPQEAERLAAVDELVFARIRQLAAHEIGHALGFMHNFASTRHHHPSVMDYPHARIAVTPDGALDLSQAYAVGLGPWDHYLVRHAYGDLTDPELAELRTEFGHLAYVTDDGNGSEAAHAYGVPWVTSGDALPALERILQVRRIALAGFSHGVLPPDRQTGELEERAVLLHLLHRHELTAAARLVGGVRYEYGVAGDGGAGAVPVDAGVQRAALERLAGLLRAEELALPESVLEVLTPPAIRYERSGQYYDTSAGPVFDPFSAVRVAATLVTEALLEPARLHRLAWQHAADASVPGVGEVVRALLSATWLRTDAVPAQVPAGTVVQRTADWAVLHHVLRVLGEGGLHAPVRAEVRSVVREFAVVLGHGDEHRRAGGELAVAYLADPGSVRLDPLPRVPAGAPN